jgi:putative ATP-dependent endonuclease of the OLD family
MLAAVLRLSTANRFKHMWIRQIAIENFRGIKSTRVDFSERQTVLVGPNGAGKSTVLEAFALLFGRDRLVRTLTEHDFFGSNPTAADRIRLTATISGFSSNVASDHSQWFSERRGVPKWLSASSGKLVAEPQTANDVLCVQLGFCARFDRSDLCVETVRYFHDDDSISDPFDEEVVQTVPARLVPELGFFLVPAHRTWDRLVSFNSELFRRILESSGSLEAAEVLAERDRLRQDAHRVDLLGVLKELREGIDSQLKQLVPGSPGLELRLTATDTESLLQALVPHYRYGNSVSLPAGRHGSGLLSLQTALLVLQIAARRRKANQNVIIAVEEPELHMPPSVQTQVLQRLRNCSNQLLCTTHSPRVAAVCAATDIRMVNPSATASTSVVPMLKAPLPSTTKNGVRKLFQENRQSFIEALMHRFVLVPEGRTDVEWLKLLCGCAESEYLGDSADSLPFGTVFGIAPTHDGCVLDTVEKTKNIRLGAVALVDGDTAGDDYAKELLKAANPPEFIVQWPKGLEMEDAVGWVLGNEKEMVKAIHAEMPTAPATVPEMVSWLKKKTNEKGAKTDLLAYEAVAVGITTSDTARARARSLLQAFVDMASEKPSSSLLRADPTRSTEKTSVWRIALEP